MRAARIVMALSVTLALGRCSCQGDTSLDGDGSTAGDGAQSGEDGSAQDSGRPRGGMGATCMRADDCETSLVCSPTSHTCVTPTACTTNMSCGPGAICAMGTCRANTPGGPCDTDAACVAGEICAGDHCVPAGCGSDLYTAEKVPPNLLLVIDRSSSMNEMIGSGATRDSKWNIAKAAIHSLVTTYSGQIFFGLSMFPGQDQACQRNMRCEPGAINVQVGARHETQVDNFVMGAATCNGTPLAEEMESLVSYPGLGDTTRENYVLLVTDGMPTCSNDPVNGVTGLKNRTPSVKTFVVGFGGGVSANQLRDMARAGGTARSGTPEYYQADDAASLRSAFAAIAGSVISCNYALGTRPPDPTQLYVYFDGAEVMRSGMPATNGWTYAAAQNQIVFHGQDCQRLQAGQVGQLVVVYGCPLPGGPDAGVRDAGSHDSGIDPGGGACTACTQCSGGQGCVIPAGQTGGHCGACTGDFDCCLGYMCLNGVCTPGF
ncbi:MAG: hypothetical protein U1E65_14995 [Myxococcota bacterium]